MARGLSEYQEAGGGMLHENLGPLSNFVFPGRAGGGDAQPILPLNLVCFDAWQALLQVSFGTQVNPILVTPEHLCLSHSLPKASTCCLSWLLSPLRTALCSLHPLKAPVLLGKRWTDYVSSVLPECPTLLLLLYLY